MLVVYKQKIAEPKFAGAKRCCKQDGELVYIQEDIGFLYIVMGMKLDSISSHQPDLIWFYGVKRLKSPYYQSLSWLSERNIVKR
jgi:hypothetical protein